MSDASNQRASGDVPPAADGRPSRAARQGKARLTRNLTLALVGHLVFALLAAGAWFGGRWYGEQRSLPPDRIVVIAESTEEDGTVVAGMIAVLERRGGVIATSTIDPQAPKSIPGTSYDRLGEALAMGGPDLLVGLVAGGPAEKRTEWLLLDEPAWARIVSAAGGVEVDVPSAATAFDGSRLFRFSAGSGRLEGDQAVALLLASSAIEPEPGAAIRERLSAALAAAVVSQPELVGAMVDSGECEFSGRRSQLDGFFVR